MATAETAQMAHAPSRFLSLPGELQNRIYELLLLYAARFGKTRSYIVPYTLYSRDDAPDLSYKTRLHPQILATSSTIAFEALPILYGKNNFVLWATHASCFTRMIGTRNTSLLKVVALYMDAGYRVPEQLKFDQAFEHGATLKHLLIEIEFIVKEKRLDKNQQYTNSYARLSSGLQHILV